MYPCIFSIGTSGLGSNTRRGSALIVMGVSGGAVFPPMQGAIADAFNIRVSFFLVVPCFLYISLWAAYAWLQDGRQTFVFKSKAQDEFVTRDEESVDGLDVKYPGEDKDAIVHKN